MTSVWTPITEPASQPLDQNILWDMIANTTAPIVVVLKDGDPQLNRGALIGDGMAYLMKALGTGIRGVRWKDFEILRLPGQAPTITLHGNAKIIADKLGIQELAISISHSRNYAVASVIAWSQDKN